jgi:hypothetical protein
MGKGSDEARSPSEEGAMAAALSKAAEAIPAYDHEAFIAAGHALEREGFATMLDHVEITKETRVERLQVQFRRPPYYQVLVKKAYREGACIRIDLHKNDAMRTLLRSLAVIEKVSSQHSRGVFEDVYRGLATVGPDAGEEQVWATVFYP